MGTNKLVHKLLWYLLVLLVVVPFFFPLFWIVSASFKTQAQIVSMPPVWLFTPTLENYQRVFVEQQFGRYLFNSAVIAVGSTLLSLIIGLPAAYTISRYKQRTLGIVILVARLMPGISYLIPWFMLFSKLRMVDTYTAVIASHMLVGLPLIVWIMVNYFDGLPRELEEAARVDGCTLQNAFFRIVLPLSGPGVLTASTLSFIFSWNNFMFSLVLSADRTKPLPIAIYNFVSYAEVSWGPVMAAAVVIITPAIILTMIFQRYVIKGLTMGAVKG
ncbi:carbohydrate ABC transporter permease [Sporolituus thermophilus]|uniref:Carbohydrate ABC transporter membrane protein 2, CUT1 family (TC 3.A.1.1.-) n=1 Tax=Sporolituus thermophilus DSM 23256 TaxID=1123285 RepID=A0A1G7HNV6_9FIRM|nr:carbohydrate ABC transporter permease [Sporolituus thermophilus]SDF02105.1 carbohydrate ABC transporter membrane protein 2, CUT1 family (TC 3.A.1.1.-) [Sporolituus thermophilus DSM 23256]